MWHFSLIFLPVLFFYYKLTLNKFYSKAILTGKVIILTGTNRVSYETALDLAKRGARVILTSSDKDKGAKLLRKIIRKSKNQNVSFEYTNFNSLTSVRKFVEGFRNTQLKLDVLVLNNEVNASDKDVGISPHVSNYYGQFLLTNLLVPTLKKSAPSRVIVTTSCLQKFGKINNLNAKGFQSYSNSKLCYGLFSSELSQRLDSYGVSVRSAAIGILYEIFKGTIFEKIFSMYTSQNVIHLAVSDEEFEDDFENIDKRDIIGNSAEKLWTMSEEWVNLESSENI